LDDCRLICWDSLETDNIVIRGLTACGSYHEVTWSGREFINSIVNDWDIYGCHIRWRVECRIPTRWACCTSVNCVGRVLSWIVYGFETNSVKSCFFYPEDKPRVKHFKSCCVFIFDDHVGISAPIIPNSISKRDSVTVGACWIGLNSASCCI
jgi:hypothetical protein